MLVGYPNGTWTIRGTITTVAATAKTAIQYAATATNEARILSYRVSQGGSTTGGRESLSIVRKTVGATVTIGAIGTNIFDHLGNTTGSGMPFRGTLSTSTTGVNATVEGTNGDEIHKWNFDALAGDKEDFQPENGIWIPASGIIALRINAILALTWDCELTIQEVK